MAGRGRAGYVQGVHRGSASLQQLPPCEVASLGFQTCMHAQGIVVTGSASDSFSNDPWIVRLRSELAEIAHEGPQVLGICFGCQIMALVLGGKAGKGHPFPGPPAWQHFSSCFRVSHTSVQMPQAGPVWGWRQGRAVYNGRTCLPWQRSPHGQQRCPRGAPLSSTRCTRTACRRCLRAAACWPPRSIRKWRPGAVVGACCAYRVR